MEWVAAEDMTARRILQLARTDLVEILSAVVHDKCADHLPLEGSSKRLLSSAEDVPADE